MYILARFESNSDLLEFTWLLALPSNSLQELVGGLGIQYNQRLTLDDLTITSPR